MLLSILALAKEYHDLFGNLDLVITEASHIRLGGVVRRNPKTGAIFGHTGIPNLIKLFQPYTSRILLTHFGSWFYKNMKNARKEIAALAREHTMEVIVGYDGLALDI